MKKLLTSTIIALTAGLAFGHGGVELGPNQGRILEFSTDESMHGELVEENGKLHIAVLDKDMKPVNVDVQAISATAGTRQEPVKLDVTKDAEAFTFATPKAGEWLILQYKETPDAKPITVRVLYDTNKCDTCKNPEWLCSCAAE
jgi:hypothetical protein